MYDVHMYEKVKSSNEALLCDKKNILGYVYIFNLLRIVFLKHLIKSNFSNIESIFDFYILLHKFIEKLKQYFVFIYW